VHASVQETVEREEVGLRTTTRSRHAGGSFLKLQKARRIPRELRSAAALIDFSVVKQVRMDALRVLSSKMHMDACVRFED